MNRKLASFSMVELLVAIGVFTIVAATGVSAVIFNYSSNRLSNEETSAIAYVQEGLDAIRSIKQADWANLANGSYGLTNASGFWQLQGTPDISGKYSRTVTISDAYRDGSGNLIDSGGTLDPSVKKIVVSVSWEFSPTNTNTIEQEIYLSNWEKSLESTEHGLLAYADYSGSDDVIRFRFYSKDDGWSDEQTVPDFDVPLNRNTRRVELYAATTRHEYVLLTKHTEDGQFLYAQIWDGSKWGNIIQLTGYGDNTNPHTRNFDGAYLANGDFIVVYDDFSYTPKYRIWNGSEWSAQGSTGDIGGYPVWIDVDASPGTNNAMVAIKHFTLSTKSMYWNGSSWSSVYTHASLASTTSTEALSLAWSHANPEILGIMYSDGILIDTTPNYRVWQTNNTWSGEGSYNVGSNSIIMKIAPSPSSNIFLGCAQDTSRDINCMRGQFNASLQSTNGGQIATNTDDQDHRSFDVAFEQDSGTTALAVYSEGSDANARRTPKWRTYNSGSNSWSNQSQLPALGPSSSYALETVRVVPDPYSDDMVVLMGDSDQGLTTVLWDGANNQFYSSGDNGLNRYAADGSFDEDYWFAFTWRQDEP